MSDLYLPVLFGTVRKENHSRGVADFVVSRGASRPGVKTHLVDPATMPFSNLLEREWEMKPAPAAVQEYVADMSRADGFVIVTPEYNHGVPGTLKNLLDHLYEEWNHKPFALVGVSSGLVGGARAVEQLRMIIPGVEGITTPYTVLVREVQDAFHGDRPARAEKEITASVDKLWTQLAWYAQAMKSARAQLPR